MSGGKAKHTALTVPFEGQCTDALEALGGKVDRLAAGEDAFNNVRRQEGKLETAPDVARVYPVALCDLLD